MAHGDWHHLAHVVRHAAHVPLIMQLPAVIEAGQEFAWETGFKCCIDSADRADMWKNYFDTVERAFAARLFK